MVYSGDRVKVKIREARKYRRMTLAEMASAFGVTEQTVSNWETGRRELKVSTLAEIANVQRMRVEYYFSSESVPAEADMTKPSAQEKIVEIADVLHRHQVGVIAEDPVCAKILARAYLYRVAKMISALDEETIVRVEAMIQGLLFGRE